MSGEYGFKRKDSEQGPPATEGGAMERRAHPRANGWGTAWIGIFPEGTKALGYLLDLGLGGCRIEADEAIPATDDASVEVLSASEGLHAATGGRDTPPGGGKTRAGIEFTDVSPRKAEQIQKLLDQLIALRVGGDLRQVHSLSMTSFWPDRASIGMGRFPERFSAWKAEGRRKREPDGFARHWLY